MDSKLLIGLGLMGFFALLPTRALAYCSSYPNTFTVGATANPAQVNANFACAALTSGSTIENLTSTNGLYFTHETDTFAASDDVLGLHSNNFLYLQGNSGGGLWLSDGGNRYDNIAIRNSTHEIDFYTNNSSAAFLVISSSGNVGVGNTAPGSRLEIGSHINDPTGALTTATAQQVNDAPTTTAASYQESLNVISVPTISGNSSAYNVAIAGTVQPSVNSYNSNLEWAGYFRANFNGTGTLTQGVGTVSQALNLSTGTMSAGFGASGYAENLSTGTMSVGEGLLGQANNLSGGTLSTGIGVSGTALNYSAGAIANAFGATLSAQNYSTGSITTAGGVYAYTQNTNTGGHITTTYGGYFDDGAHAGSASVGTVTTAYGVYIGALYGTTKYGLYQSDGGANNYFAAKVGIGATSPAQALEVNGEVQVDTLASAASTSVCITATSNGVLATCSSSIRYKENVRDAGFGLKDVMAMRPVTFKWKSRDERDFGLIAEEVAEVNPLFVTYTKGKIEGVKYPQLTAVLINAIKELETKNLLDAKAISALTNELNGFRVANARLAQEMSAMRAAQEKEIRELQSEIAGLPQHISVQARN